MIEVKGKVTNQPITILIDLGGIHSYIALGLDKTFHGSKHEKPCLAQLYARIKIKEINEIVVVH